MKISHEIPLELLEESQFFNDYDYCLLHLTYTCPEYKEYYRQAALRGRDVLLDNSLFELGDALSGKELAQGILDLRPTQYVVPDSLNNCDITIERFKAFKRDFPTLPGKAIGAVQGSTLEELVECYEFMSRYADKIAIPFDSLGFTSLYRSSDPLETYCKGRPLFIKYLVDNGLWNYQKPHHLLGCSYAKEFDQPLYRELNIESCDTSNPVVAGIKGLRYNEFGLSVKPAERLCDLIRTHLSPKMREDIYHNIRTFKRICRGTHQQWVCFFSQTGGEINNVRKAYGRNPDLIIFNGQDLSNVCPELLKDCGDKVLLLPQKPGIDDYAIVENLLEKDCLITLHGYLRIIPKELCDKYSIYNLHPGLITKYPQLKGFNPQEKAFKEKLPTTGVVIHKVVPEVDSGEVLLSTECDIRGKSLEDIYQTLHSAASALWVSFFKNYVKA